MLFSLLLSHCRSAWHFVWPSCLEMRKIAAVTRFSIITYSPATSISSISAIKRIRARVRSHDFLKSAREWLTFWMSCKLCPLRFCVSRTPNHGYFHTGQLSHCSWESQICFIVHSITNYDILTHTHTHTGRKTDMLRIVLYHQCHLICDVCQLHFYSVCCCLIRPRSKSHCSTMCRAAFRFICDSTHIHTNWHC